MVSTNLFATAKPVSTVAAPAGKKSKKLETHIDGLAMYGLVDATEKAIKALKETYRTIVEPQVEDVFVVEGQKIGRQPENFVGTDGNVRASCELRKRSSASALNDLEQELLAKHGVSTEKKVTVQEAFIFNPAYMGDSKLMEAISKALTGVKGIPADLILKQEEVKSTVTTEDSIDQVMAIKDQAVVRQLLSIVATKALKPTVTDFDLADALATIAGQVKEDA